MEPEQLEKLKQLRTFFAGVPPKKVNMACIWEERYTNGNNADYSCLSAGCLWGWAGVYKPFGIPLNKVQTIFYVSEFANYFGVSHKEAKYLCNPSDYEDAMVERSGDRILRQAWHADIPKELVLERLDEVISRYEVKS